MKQEIKSLMSVAMACAIFSACDNTSRSTIPCPPPKGSDKSARDIRGASPYIEIANELPPRLIVDPPLPDLLAQGVIWIQWRVENVNILPVFGKGALNASPRVGHLHIQVDDLSWWWADASNINTIDLAGVSPGSHKIKITLVNANHQAFPGQSTTVSVTIPEGAKYSHSH